MSKQKLSSFIYHILLFVLIEVLFIIVLFREIPTVDFISLLGILHLSYWVILIIAGWLRESYAKKVWSKGLCTYLPVLYHVFTHIYATWYAIEEHGHEDTEGHMGEPLVGLGEHESILHHSTHDLTWIIVGAIVLGILVFIGEYLLHRKIHCDSHHEETHEQCHDKDCEKKHTEE